MINTLTTGGTPAVSVSRVSVSTVGATRRAEHGAGLLAALGCQARVLDGGWAAGVLRTATDPFAGLDSPTPPAIPGDPITADLPWSP